MTTVSAAASASATTASSGSYSTATASAASYASARVRASTTATASPTNTTLPTATGQWSGFFMSAVTGQAHGMAPAQSARRSSPVKTWTTPGRAAAASVAMEVMRACACGLRTRAIQSAPGTTRSSTKRDAPVMSGGSSRRSSRWPITVVIADLPGRASSQGPGGSGLVSGGEDGLDDVVVAGAPAEVALEPVADVVLRRVRVLLEEAHGRHDHPGR